jgi:hypothetical protein
MPDAPSPKRFRRAILLFVVFGLVFVAAGFDQFYQAVEQARATSPIRGGLLTTGTVISWTVHHGARVGETYTPIIAYTVGGQSYTFSGIYAESRPRFGSSVTVSYDPADPAHAHDLSAGRGHTLSDTLFGVALLLFSGFWFYVLARAARRQRRLAAPAPSEPEWDPTWDESLRNAPRDDERGR